MSIDTSISMLPPVVRPISAKRLGLLDILAALPVATCFVAPVLQIKGVIYIYDLLTMLAIVILWFPHVEHPALRRFDIAWSMLVVAIAIGCMSAIMRVGVTFRIVGYSTQFMLGLIYCRCLVLCLVSQRVNLKRFCCYCALAGAAAASLGVFQYFLLQTNPSLADELYRRYLDLSGFDPTEYENYYLHGWEATGNVRVLGTWTVTTTYGGMMALAGAWLLLTGWPLWRNLIVYGVSCLAVLATLSRHAWFITAIVLISLFFTSRQKRGWLIYAFLGAVMITLLVVTLSSSGSEGVGISQKDFVEQLQDRTDRTLDEGLDDSSIQARYVAGTFRFIIYAFRDPIILATGFGIQTESGLDDQFGPDGLQYGYVSNGWLLIWRNCGILGILGLALMHINLYRVGGKLVLPGVIITALIFVSDNYPVHHPAPFFLLMTFLACLWAVALMPKTLENSAALANQ